MDLKEKIIKKQLGYFSRSMLDDSDIHKAMDELSKIVAIAFAKFIFIINL